MRLHTGLSKIYRWVGQAQPMVQVQNKEVKSKVIRGRLPLESLGDMLNPQLGQGDLRQLPNLAPHKPGPLNGAIAHAVARNDSRRMVGH